MMMLYRLYSTKNYVNRFAVDYSGFLVTNSKCKANYQLFGYFKLLIEKELLYRGTFLLPIPVPSVPNLCIEKLLSRHFIRFRY